MKIQKERRNSLWFIGILWMISGIAAGVTSRLKTLRKLLNTRILNMQEKKNRNREEKVKVSTIIFLVFAGLGMLGYLCYGWLLLEALSSEKGVLASFTFTNLLILWLLPFIIALILLTLKLVKRKQQR